MSKNKTLLDETLDRWYRIRRGLIHECNAIPASRFTFRATLETRTAIELLQHVLEFSIITVEELAREDTDFNRAPITQLANVYAPNISRADTKEKIVNLLVEQFQDARTRFEELGYLFMMQQVPTFDGGKATRLELLQDAIGHEQYHRGQLTIYERLLGLVPALTKEGRKPVSGSAY